MLPPRNSEGKGAFRALALVEIPSNARITLYFGTGIDKYTATLWSPSFVVLQHVKTRDTLPIPVAASTHPFPGGQEQEKAMSVAKNGCEDQVRSSVGSFTDPGIEIVWKGSDGQQYSILKHHPEREQGSLDSFVNCPLGGPIQWPHGQLQFRSIE